jgi:ABC-2 type transport system permease protein
VPKNAAHASVGTWWSWCLAVYRLEMRVQRREPATVLYALVFVLLTFGFISSGTVELVRDRGALPKLSPLAIALAMGGLTAFGQVITTMITASALLRDVAWRTDHLLATTALDRRAWLLGRWAAASSIMLLVYAGLLAGVLLGAAAPWVEHDVPWLTVLQRAVWPWITITVPTTLAVGALLTVAAVRTRSLLGVLSVALGLLFLWQGCEALARRDLPSAWATVVGLADPFGTVAVQQVTSEWSAAMRATALVPASGLVGAGRLLWLGVAAIAMTLTMLGLRGGGHVLPAGRPALHETAATARHVMTVPFGHSRLGTIAAFTTRWTWRERGWRVIALLGMVNVFAHALGADGAVGGTIDGAQLVALVREHARLFLILLATIYAGELVWRDQDQRVVELVESTPVRTLTLVGGRVLGLVVSQGALVSALLVAATLGAMLRQRAPVSIGPLVLGGGLWVLLPFVQWLVLSLAVHVALRHKVIAHLVLIAGWVAAVALDANGVTSPWVRFADPPALRVGEALPLRDATVRAVWWTSVSAALFALTLLGWKRATARR